MTKNILLIDDDEEICEEIVEILKDEGYAVDAIFDGRKGKKIMEGDGYDLLLLDIKMPGISGLEILKAARNKKIRAKVILLTGSLIVDKFNQGGVISLVSHDESSLKLADAIIPKPFDIEILLAKIKSLVG